MKSHIDSGIQVKCPFESCLKSFSKKSSFTSHVSRYHKTGSIQINQDHQNEQSEFNVSLSESVDLSSDDVALMSSDEIDPNIMLDTIVTQQEFSHNFALFCLKLQAELLIPQSTVQCIVEELQVMHDVVSESSILKLKNKLQEEGMPENTILAVIDHMKSSYEWGNVLNKESGSLRSVHLRKCYYQTHMNYVRPETVCLGRDHIRGAVCYHYVPVKKTLMMLMNDKAVQNHVQQLHQSCKTGLLSDYTDGTAFKKNDFFKANSRSLHLILFQDAFQVVNPLGSSKKKYKILAVYLSLGNLPPQLRSSTNQMQLVLLCLEKDFKEFGQEKVFGRLIKDLKDVEQTGVETPVGLLKGSVVAITGDNLGSHCIGGFTENFSTTPHFCRYCNITKNEFLSGKGFSLGEARSTTSYSEAINYLADNPEETMHTGIKFNSVFNSLQYFHVCNPGLPPCLGHDLFEGVVSFDLSIYLRYFIRAKHWFTYNILNRKIQKFKYLSTDVSNRPAEVNSKGIVLGGHAVQNWCLLRLLPLIIGSKIENTDDPCWQLCLLLREIVELVCAPCISREQICFLQVIVEEYLEERKHLFPECSLKPKHHYLSHYAELIGKFGPLMRLWTMRFESKHGYFKKCLRNSQNYKNITKTMSERHQLLQTYYSSGSVLPAEIEVKSAIPLHPDLYTQSVTDQVQKVNLSADNSVVSQEISYNGTVFKKGLYVPVGTTEDDVYTFGCIMMIVVKNGKCPYVVVRLCQTTYLSDLGVYKLLDEHETDSHRVSCIAICDLLDWFPLPAYSIEGQQVVVLKHKFSKK